MTIIVLIIPIIVQIVLLVSGILYAHSYSKFYDAEDLHIAIMYFRFFIILALAHILALLAFAFISL